LLFSLHGTSVKKSKICLDLPIYGSDFIFRKIYIYATITIKTAINFVVKMTKLYMSIVVGIVLFSALSPAIYASGNSIAPIELKGLVWEDDEGIWSNCVSADKSDILRFNVKYCLSRSRWRGDFLQNKMDNCYQYPPRGSRVSR
ncbi:MAG: hypothetical protein J7K13_04175, partial [Thermoplasmata archaeon]|nr:hypothetical protein [Thermoplasmata archaeon]